jgi:catechol 2,3-dioxygenase-like lactoylglutathione lyase family enzyme
MPRIARVIETALYVDDLTRAKEFYMHHLDLSQLFCDERMCAFAVGESVLLLFVRGEGASPARTPGGVIPPHDGHGPLHVAFAIDKSDLEAWERRLDRAGIDLESKVDWPRGGKSIYFRDPDGHLLELATPGLWANY